MSLNIVVLGAGVIGLTTALELKRWNREVDVTIVAQHIPGDIDKSYTSPFAGANWQSFATKEDVGLQEIDKSGYREFTRLANSDPKSGIWTKDNVAYFTEYELARRNGSSEDLIPWYKDYVHNFETIEKKDLPDGIAFGTRFTGVVISVPTYLNYLVQKNLEIGNTIKKVEKLRHIKDALLLHSSGKLADYVINATGLMATSIEGISDTKRTFPVRGQVLLVKNNARVQMSVEGFPGYENEMLYMMPRVEGGTIIGGCFLEDDLNFEEDKQLTRRIVDRAIKYAPELIDPGFKNNPTQIEIAKVNVGFRPFRVGGARVELDEKYKWLIHNYGAGGGGYQGSYGLSKLVIDILEKQNVFRKAKL
ncbi:DAO1 [[Candida] subhashii]|uniref:DAO1 n=1 Tax=[Candida] subhashii TaxID=561895 RepID=A0A8J5QD41_9ASCO|nr:DAO1 [[Candida] subhashii]KAG7664004.1 DAO1 [[Candida] subhashii]